MSLITLFTENTKTEYKARPVTPATLFYILCTALNLLVPLAIVYRSDGIWIKKDSYLEQPDINFKHQLFISLVTADGDHLLYTNLPKIQKSFNSKHVRIPRIKNYEKDSNGDYIFDEMVLQINFPLKSRETVSSATIILLFDYKLEVKLAMESLIVLSGNCPFPSSGLHFMGEMRFHQKELLANKGYNTRFRNCVSEIMSQDASVNNLMLEYLKQNLSTRFSHGSSTSLWTAGKSSDDNFEITINLLYPEDTFDFKPGFWYMMKWAWVQYFSLYVIFYFLIRGLKKVVYSNHLLSTFIVSSKE